MDDAVSVFRDMLTRDTHARSAAIVAYATHGHGFQAISMLEEMKEKVQPDEITILGILYCMPSIVLNNQVSHSVLS